MPLIEVPEGKGDPEVRVWALRPEMGMGAGALSHAIYEQSIVPVREREVARMRIALINGCAICQQWRKTPGAEGNITEADYAHVLDWATYDGYSERERLAVEYAELFAEDHHKIDDAFYGRMRAAGFSEPEILDLTVCIGGWLALGRTLHVLGLDDCVPDRRLMGDLAIDTHVDGGDGRYTAKLSRDWEIWGPNGGYIASIALRAAGAHSQFDRPASIVGHFLGVASFDAPLDIETKTLRAAKRAESVRVSLTSEGNPVFEAMVWAVGDVGGLEHDESTLPALPDPESLPTVPERLGDRQSENPYHRFWSNFDERVRDEDWITDWQNRPPMPAVANAWYRYVPRSTFDDPWVDACRPLLLVDTLGWPAAGRAHPNSEYMAPSIDLSCGFHRFEPDEPWLFAQAISPSSANGLVGCDARVWSRTGTLLAHGSSQLLCRPWRPA